MFTGIIEVLGEVLEIKPRNNQLIITVGCTFAHELKIDQSVALNGVCLTVTDLQKEIYSCTAIGETLKKTNLSALKVGSKVNLERAMIYQARLDGHIVQGHVDKCISCTKINSHHGDWDYWFSIPHEDSGLIIPRGSVTLNGVSLTIAEINGNQFKVSIIPYTYEHTTFHDLIEGEMVNIEYDVLGKYVLRNLDIQSQLT